MNIPSRWGYRGALLSYQRSGLVVKVKHKSDLLRWSTVSSSDILAGLVIPGPRVLRGCHNNTHATLHLAKDHVLVIWPLSLGSAGEKLGTVALGPVSAMDRCQDPYTSGRKSHHQNDFPSMDLTPVPLCCVKSLPWHMNLGTVLWKQELLKPNPFSPMLRTQKFSAVFGSLQTAWRRCAPRAHPWQRCQTQWGDCGWGSCGVAVPARPHECRRSQAFTRLLQFPQSFT